MRKLCSYLCWLHTSMYTAPPPSPVHVQAFCSHVVWRNFPNVSCDIISGYDVRLVNPAINQNVTRHVDALATFYSLHSLDDSPLKRESATVQFSIYFLSEWHRISVYWDVGVLFIVACFISTLEFS